MSKHRWTRGVVKHLRARLNFTQQELAARVGVSQVTVARWEMKKGSSPSRLAKVILEELKAQLPLIKD